MHFETSPGSSPSKSIPISFRTMASPSGSVFSMYSHDGASCSQQGSTSACAYPSWPTGKSLEYRSTPSSFISDEDLFGDDFEDSLLLQEAPAPPRQPPMAQAFPILPPLYASEKPKKQRRRSSGRKQRRPSKPMSVISESPEAAE
ncbi:hypothetical protein K505DRAFT_69355 [Melanomma pulvis-pyrius CBS 109.77]|uniref:Uncharacterized protein n=1 Tax=Melanomma pulvis-pyrius CBS 109.77 TaxID=1314802 RepID=A0A6A6X4J7_9PLEO|nr:hypothetical protein K505DRAFT_69355 [Melanomma pulvis-pyrius CBS 109.77]